MHNNYRVSDVFEINNDEKEKGKQYSPYLRGIMIYSSRITPTHPPLNQNTSSTPPYSPMSTGAWRLLPRGLSAVGEQQQILGQPRRPSSSAHRETVKPAHLQVQCQWRGKTTKR